MRFKLYTSLIVLLFLSHGVSAKGCTYTDRSVANEILIGLENNKNEKLSLLKYHMPFGAHESIKHSDSEKLFYQKGFLAQHDKDLRTSIWTSYRLTKTDLVESKGKKRVDCFRTDPRLDRDNTGSSSDYNEPVYDRGHLTPDADLKDRFYDQLNSYTYINFAPQHCFFNRGIWLNLEHLVRNLAYKEGEIYVTSGAIFDRDNIEGRDDDEQAQRMVSRNNKKRVAVPSHFYKVILKRNGNQWSALAFLLPHNNEDHGRSWEESKPYALSNVVELGVIEKKASVNLFPMIPDNQIYQNINDWDLSKAGNAMTGRCKA